MSFLAGLDWGATGHAVCVLDEKGAVARLEVRHDVAGLADLRARAWTERQPYDQNRHTAARPILQTQGG